MHFHGGSIDLGPWLVMKPIMLHKDGTYVLHTVVKPEAIRDVALHYDIHHR
jgi:hypothetical protein